MSIEVRQLDNAKDKQAAWELFRPYHYAPSNFVKSSECYLVALDGRVLGFIAAKTRPAKTPHWYAHKTAVLLPITHPDYFRLWALFADTQARMQVAQGRRFITMAPIDHAAYRDAANSGWMPSTKDKQRQKCGYRSHEYIGASLAAGA